MLLKRVVCFLCFLILFLFVFLVLYVSIYRTNLYYFVSMLLFLSQGWVVFLFAPCGPSSFFLFFVVLF